jgi:uncharacterized protein (TIGR02118 family)
MVRLLILYELPVDEAAFLHHFHEVRLPLVKTIPGVRRHSFSQKLILIRGSAPVFLVEALDWDDLEAFSTATQSPAGVAAAQDITDHLEPLSPGMRSMFYEVIDD